MRLRDRFIKIPFPVKIGMALLVVGLVILQVYVHSSMHVDAFDDAMISKHTRPVAVNNGLDDGNRHESKYVENHVQDHAKQEMQTLDIKSGRPHRYKSTWTSLDARPLPAWYDEAKFGIFIHWGVFSVPSYVNEWFWQMWKDPNNYIKGTFKSNRMNKIKKYMEDNYPKGFTYAEFAPQFKADLFKPDHWADLFKESGAKYVVLTSKHHEGYTMWPSSVSFNWNSMAVGPKRDLVGDLAEAVRRRTDLRFGLYHSLFEWYNPLYLFDKKHDFKTQRFVQDKTMPELYELVNTYKPDVIWSDGDWLAPDTYWNSTDFLAWLYNDSPVRDTVVTNDRWGNGTRMKHGGFYSGKDRFNPGKLVSHKWENCMTIDRLSWGYRREAVLSDYFSIEDLIKVFVESVSCGGNILINIGPTSSGRIAPIFEERLRQMGEWLKVNGEAIYSTKPWKHQNDTVTPNIWYTSKKSCGKTSDFCHLDIYAILLKWPTSPTIQLTDVKPSWQTEVTLVGYQGSPLKWSKTPDGQSIILHVPIITFHQMPCQWSWTFKMTNLL